MPPTDVAWLKALEVFTLSKIHAHLATRSMAIGALISHLVKHAQEAEDSEVDLHGHLDDALN